MKYTLAQYLSAVTLRPFSKTDFDAFCGVETENPLIGYGNYGPTGPRDGPPEDVAVQFTLIVDGNDVQVIINDRDDTLPTVFYTATANWV